MDESLDLITPLQKYSPEKQLKKKRKKKGKKQKDYLTMQILVKNWK